ncbi:MAG: hypothetical protein JWN48_1057 [Myxococcaceae bacterium]|nr:hypothetical protein [Myxococcaceae bacterium]
MTSGCLLVDYDPVVLGLALDAAVDASKRPPEPDLDATSDGRRDALIGERDVATDSPSAHDATEPGTSDGSLADAALAEGGDTQPDASDAAAAADTGPACDAGVNACGGCTTLAHAPASACGQCGLGTYTCDGTDAVLCVGGAELPKSSGGLVLIDDFEDGDSNVNPTSGLSGVWYTLSDSTSGTINPTVGSKVVPTSGGAQGSTRSVHVSGHGFTYWGAGLAASLSAYQCKYDGSAQRGVQFYAKGTGALQVALATRQTVQASQGGECVSGCDDHFNVAVPLSGSWQLHTVTFSSLKQSGFGTASTFQPTQLMYVQFYFGPNVTFDLSVDNVSFY